MAPYRTFFPKSTAKKIERCYKKKYIKQLSEHGTGKSFTS